MSNLSAVLHRFSALVGILVTCVATTVLQSGQVPNSGTVVVNIHDGEITRCRAYYMLRGPFGAHVTFAYPTATTGNLELATSVRKLPAESLKAYVYCPGSQFELVDVPNLRDPPITRVDVHLKPLGTLPLSGMLHGLKGITDPLDVEARYSPVWSCQYFLLLDCLVPAEHVAAAPVDADGRFVIRLPDFANDPALRTFAIFPLSGTFRFRARNAATATAIFDLQPVGSVSGGVQIRAAYPDVHSFELVPIRQPRN